MYAYIIVYIWKILCNIRITGFVNSVYRLEFQIARKHNSTEIGRFIQRSRLRLCMGLYRVDVSLPLPKDRNRDNY
jgi:hypothetical protein